MDNPTVAPQLVLNPWTQRNLAGNQQPTLGLNAPDPNAQQTLAIQPPAPQQAPMAAGLPPDTQSMLAAPPVTPAIDPYTGLDMSARTVNQQGELANQAAGITADAQAKQAAAEGAGIQSQQQLLAQDLADHKAAKDHVSALQARRELAIQDFMGQKVDPNRAWNAASTGGKVLSAGANFLSTIMGGISQGAALAAGHVIANPALERIDKAINDDISAQKENISNHYKGLTEQGSLVDSEENRMKHEQDYNNAYRTNAWTLVGQQMKQIGDESASPLTKNAAQQAQLAVQDKVQQMGQAKYNSILATQQAERSRQAKQYETENAQVAAERDRLTKVHEKDEKPYTEADLDHDLGQNVPGYLNRQIDNTARRALYAGGVINPTADQLAYARGQVVKNNALPKPTANRPVAGLPQQNPQVAVEATKVEAAQQEKVNLVSALGSYIGHVIPDYLQKELVAKGVVTPETSTHFFGDHNLTSEQVEDLKRQVRGGETAAPTPSGPKALKSAGELPSQPGKME